MHSDNRIKVRADGPLLCTGDVEVYDSKGRLLKKSADLVLCRCGQSADKPFCDGSHRNAAFRHDGMFVDAKLEEAGEAAGPLQISVRENAMLIARGPMTLQCADGSVGATRNKAALCRCGHSRNKPFCDGSHKAAGFEG